MVGLRLDQVFFKPVIVGLLSLLTHTRVDVI